MAHNNAVTISLLAVAGMLSSTASAATGLNVITEGTLVPAGAAIMGLTTTIVLTWKIARWTLVQEIDHKEAGELSRQVEKLTRLVDELCKGNAKNGG